jgi:hypothetical protein
VITHLFADGGRIIASRKTGYAEHLGASDLSSIVKRLMQEQHKALFIELRDCVYDDQPLPSAPHPAAPEAAAATAAVAASLAPPSGAAPALPVPPSASSVSAAVAALPALAPAPGAAASSSFAGASSVAGPYTPPAPAAAGANAPALPRTAVAVPAPRFVGTPPPMAIPSRVQLDAEALDRAAEARLSGSAIGRARVEAARRGAGRYQQTLAAKPSRAPRAANARSTFGGEALRGKSLDEVILSYLSDDTGESER